jgi:hypothetical protein
VDVSKLFPPVPIEQRGNKKVKKKFVEELKEKMKADLSKYHNTQNNAIMGLARSGCPKKMVK